MSKTIEVIMRHMAPPPSRLTDQSNRVEKLEKEITVKKRHYICRKRGSCAHASVSFQYPSRLQWNGSRRQKRTDLMTLIPPEGTKVWIRIEGPDAQRQCTRSTNSCKSALKMIDEPLRDCRDATFSEDSD